MKTCSKVNMKEFTILMILLFTFVNLTALGQTAIKTVNGVANGPANLMISGNQAKEFPVGQVFNSGTTFETIGQTVELGANGNSQLLNPHSKHKIRFIGDKELHTTTKGKVTHQVNIPESRYKISTPGVEGNSVTTRFEVEVSGNATRIKSFEGTVNTYQKVPLEFETATSESKGPKNVLNASIYNSISDGQEMTFYSNPEPVTYGTLQDALNMFVKELEKNEEMNFPDEQLANDNALVGELYLDMEEPAQAIPYFNKAIMYYKKFYFTEQDIAEMDINLAEAYYVLGQDDDFIYHGSKAISVLLSENEFNKEDLYFAEMEEDEYLVKLISEDLYFNYFNIAWVYDIAGDEVNAKKYYDMAKEYN